MRKFVVWSAMKNEHGNGVWAVFDGMVTVRTATGTKTTQLGGSTPESLARILMWELANEQRPEVA